MENEAAEKFIRTEVLAAGFVRCAFLSPFTSEAYRLHNIEGAPSLLVCALPYGSGKKELAVPASEGEGAVFGVIAPFACYNYYKEAVKRLKKLSLVFRKKWGGTKKEYRIFCNSRIPEKTIAAACGLGAIGRNSLLLTPEAGSQVIVAAMTLPFSLSSGKPLGGNFEPCANCPQENPPCAAACPSGAVCFSQKTIELKKCIQWYASGNGDAVPDAVASVWGKRFYGCVNCQDACPHNGKRVQGAETNEGAVEPFIEINSFLGLSDEEITKKFKGTALGMSWLGAAALKRNATLCRKGKEP